VVRVVRTAARMKYAAFALLALALAVLSQRDFLDALVAIAQAARWQHDAWVGLVCVSGSAVTLVVIGGVVMGQAAVGVVWEMWRGRA
jgi:hypothetical protein